MTFAISAPDLYEKCTKAYLEKELPENDIPSFSWFKLNFGPKDLMTHTTLNYTGCFSVKYMVLQRMIRKTYADDYYTNVISKYAHEYTGNIRDICSFICMDDKHRISMGEPNFPLAAVPHGRQVLVVNNESFRVGGHDF